MAATIQLTFYIYLTDAALVAGYQAQYPGGVSRGVLPAATEFAAPYIPEGSPVTYPCTRTGWMPPGASGKFPLDRAFFTINDGFFGHLFGRDQKYAWIGQFVFQAPVTQQVIIPTGDFTPPAPGEPATGGTSVPPGPCREIAFAYGFENSGFGSNNGPESQTSYSNFPARHASRTPDGFGFSLRNESSFVTQVNWTAFGATPGTRAWERFYVRIERLGQADCGIWRMRWGNNVGLSNSGLALLINSSGALILRNVGSGGSFFPVASSGYMGQGTPLSLNRWHCIDVVYTNALTVQAVDVWVDHAMDIRVEGFLHGEGSVNRIIDSSNCGPSAGGAASGAEIDMDDHVGFILPAGAAQATNTYWGADNPGPDWIHGHHVYYIEPQSFDASHNPLWVGDFRTLTQRDATQQAEDAMVSSTSGALIAVNTRADLALARDGVIGWQALLVSMLSRRAGAVSGQLGYSYTETTGGTATTVMTAVTQSGAGNQWNAVAARPLSAALTVPKALASFQLRFTKAADATATQVAQLYGGVVAVGVWDQCDGPPIDEDVADIADPTRYGIHNAEYPRSPWVRTEVPPDSPVWVKAGTYTGNSLGQDVIAKIPAHFWFVRATNNTTGAVKWWSSMHGAKWSTVGDVRGGVNIAQEDPEFVAVGGDTDPESRSHLRIGGANAAENLTAVTYQYIAIGDPGMRFLLCGAFDHDNSVASAVNNLTDPNYLPEFMLAYTEAVAGGGFAWLKGPAHGATSGGRTDGGAAAVTTFGDFATGQFTSRVTLHPSGSFAVPYVMFRQRDGGNYAALDLTEPVIVQIMSYTGDGVASRTLALPRASGKRPLWALCGPTDGSQVHVVRDPTHTTTTSSLITAGSATVATSITAGGIDQITVGITLNANGVPYNLLVIMAGDATAGNNGWGTNGETLYDPIPAPGGQWDPGYTQAELDELENPTVTPEDESFDDGPVLEDDLADDLCVPFTLRAANLALARLGITDLMTTADELLTPTSQERTILKAFYEHTLRFVLRDFPWAHATRYASLTLLEGDISDPVNADWVYSFRAPSAVLFVRRVIRPEVGRKHDPNPPAFRMAVDTIGPLVYVTDDGVQFDSNDEPFVEIEYTVRPACGAKAGGDQKFVSAFAFRLAYEMATGLSRDEKTIARMERGYIIEKNSAATTVQNEQKQQPPGDPDWLLGR